ncbi:glycosyltransferase [Nocardioides taihuensis]|uniref:Glycosyltransferase n=1 Tax=Nocardioides taihuensis TaxID=1835606 RepID=A0ABW0BMK8_9ACTN
MSDILFVTWDGGGNVPPATAIARELVARGHTVRFLGHAAQVAALEEEGVEVVRGRHARAYSRFDRYSPLTMMAVFGDRGMGRDLLEETSVRRYDLVVIDCLMVGALAAAREAGLRYAVLEHLYDAYFRRTILGGPMGLNLRLRRLAPQRSLEDAAVRLVTSLPELDPVPDPPANLRQVGPVVPLSAPATQGGDPTVLVSLSTFGYPGMTAALQRLVDATRDLDARVVVTTGPAVDPADIRAPRGTEVHRFVPHAELMPGLSLFVGHGGHGSTMTALGHDLPLVLMPMDGLADQPGVADSVERAGAGRRVAKKASPADLAPVLAAMLADGPHRAAAARLGAAVRAQPGAILGADALEVALDGSVTPGGRPPR